MRESDSGRRSVRSLRTGSSSTRSSAMPRISEPFCRRENAVFRSPWAPDAVAWGRKLRGEFGRIRTPRKRKAGRGSQRTTGFVELASLSMLSDICIQLAGAVGGIGCRGRVSSSRDAELHRRAGLAYKLGLGHAKGRPATYPAPSLTCVPFKPTHHRPGVGPARADSARVDSARVADDARPPTPDPRQPTADAPRSSTAC